MNNPNPIKYSELVAPDSAITDLIKQLQDLIGTYENAKSKIQSSADAMAKGMQNVSSATEQQREQIKLVHDESDRLVKQYRDVNSNLWQVTQAYNELKQAKKEQTQIDKLVTQINTSMEGSYNKLSAMYRLNKIRLNEMSEAERNGTESGRKLEAETKAIYEQMNRLQMATGKAQLQVGHYERGLLSAVGVSGRFADALMDSTKAGEMFKGITGSLLSPLGLVAGAIGAGIGALKLYKDSIDSTQGSGDRWKISVAGMEGAWDRFKKSIATSDFTNILQGLRDSAQASRELAKALDEVFERTNSVILQKADMAETLADLEERMRNSNLPIKERKQAIEDYMKAVAPLYEQEIETAKRVRDAELENLFAITNQRKFASDAEREQAKKSFAENIKNYNLNETLIKQANKYNEALAEKEYYENADVKVLDSIRERYEGIINGADASVKAFAGFAKQYQFTNDAQVKAYVDAEQNLSRARVARFQDNKKIVTLQHNLEAQETKEAEANAKARIKAQEDEVKAAQKAQEEKAKADAQAIADAEKARKAEQDALNALLQSQLQSINLEIAITEEGTDRMLELRIAMIQKQREIELEANRQKAEALRQDEQKINAKYDSLVYKQTADFYVQLANREFKAKQQIDANEFAMMQTTEAEKTRFRLSQERERLEQILRMNEQASTKMTDLEVKAVQTAIAKIDNELKKVRNRPDLLQMIGLGNLDSDQKQAINSAVSETLKNISSIVSAWQQATEARIASAEANLDATQRELDAEIEARNNGYANNVSQAQKNVELQRKELADAQKEKEKAVKAQLALDTITQTASLITASANIWSSLSIIPIIGPALAIAMLATMWSSFGLAKIKAAQVASSGTEKYAEGTIELLQGGSHASGNDIDMGTKPDGTKRRAEGGEFFAVINKRNSRRYRNIIPDVINSLNDGTFAKKYERANESMSGIAMSIASGGTDVSGLEKDVKAIRKQGEESRFVDGQGNTIVKYKNLTKVIKVS